MRLLAISDIHNNLVAVRKLRATEQNRFDAVVVAGDIGNASAAEFFKIVSSFDCPVAYVFGNWDYELEYAPSLSPGCSLIHMNVVSVGNFNITGFSGCPTKWGKNPIATKFDIKKDSEAGRRVLQLNREQLKRTLAQLDPRRTIVVTHERLSRVAELAPNILLHLFGHIHQFSDRTNGQSRFLNVSVLDRQVSARPRHLAAWTVADLRNYNAGNYAVIELGTGGEMTVECKFLPHSYPEWIAIENRRHNGIGWIVEELGWRRADDPKLIRFQEGI